MATERLFMRQIREILRRNWVLSCSHRQVAASLAASLGLLLFLTLLPPAHADLSEAEGMIGISVHEVGWVVRFPREGYTLPAERDHPDGRVHYYLLSHNVTGLNASVRVEPDGTCAAAEASRDAYWGTGVRSWPPRSCWTALSGTGSRCSNSP